MASKFKQIDFSSLKTFPIKDRVNMVSHRDFSDPRKYTGNENLSSLFPSILKGNDFRKVAESVKSAKKKKKPVIVAIGAHVIKCGLSLLFIDLLRRGFISGVAMNGAGAIHDYEIAMVGETSENVAVEIQEGRFGMVHETGQYMNDAFKKHVDESVGMGEALGRDLSEKKYPFSSYSILQAGYEMDIPVTIHSAIGTEIIHMHPSADGTILGQGTFNDFKLFVSSLSEIGNGGVFFNIGSSVILPEVFLKAISMVRNMGHDAKEFTTVNFDMVQHYRPNVNVVKRPVQGEGSGFSITGHHEILIPLLYSMIVED
ncbi:MAG: hypothetical protein ACE5FU_08740 [Nitrospinota bacterium]